jgi:hypothetical protein
VELAELYLLTQRGLIGTLRALSLTDAARTVPATPAWCVRELAAHLAGVGADLVAGRVEGAGSDEWSARQVSEREGDSLLEICAAWSAQSGAIGTALQRLGGGALRPVIDLWTHEQDIAGALERRGARGDGRDGALATAAIAGAERRWVLSGAPSIVIATESLERQLGADPAVAKLWTSDYELLRMILGRRSRSQVEAGTWEGQVPERLEALFVFEPPRAELFD